MQTRMFMPLLAALHVLDWKFANAVPFKPTRPEWIFEWICTTFVSRRRNGIHRRRRIWVKVAWLEFKWNLIKTGAPRHCSKVLRICRSRCFTWDFVEKMFQCQLRMISDLFNCKNLVQWPNIHSDDFSSQARVNQQEKCFFRASPLPKVRKLSTC